MTDVPEEHRRLADRFLDTLPDDIVELDPYVKDDIEKIVRALDGVQAGGLSRQLPGSGRWVWWESPERERAGGDLNRAVSEAGSGGEMESETP